MQSIVEDKQIELPVALDRQGPDAAVSPGATAQALGIKFAPTTVVIDRSGKVRAAGLKPDFLDKVLNGLLAEPTPTEPEAESAAPTTADTDKSSETAVLMANRPDEGQPPAP
jgi:hypothetical protein